MQLKWHLWLFKSTLSIRLMLLWLEEPPLLIYASVSKSKQNCYNCNLMALVIPYNQSVGTCISGTYAFFPAG